MRAHKGRAGLSCDRFPFLFGGTFIEGVIETLNTTGKADFPSFSEGLSLRAVLTAEEVPIGGFPFLFGGTFIEGSVALSLRRERTSFPFLFGGTFIEGRGFPEPLDPASISLPFRRDFH